MWYLLSCFEVICPIPIGPLRVSNNNEWTTVSKEETGAEPEEKNLL